MLKLKHLHKSIGGTVITDNITASFPVGKITALVGPNGAGKTSLFNLITGAVAPDSGKVIYHNHNLAGMPSYQIARYGVGRLFQDVRIFANLSVLENVMTACYRPEEEQPWFPFLNPLKAGVIKRRAMEKAEDILSHFSLRDKLQSSAGALSFGQQKLLAIARLLAAECSLLLFDEPTAGLNQAIIREVLRIIQKIIQEDNNKTIIVVEHDMRVVSEIAEWIFFMNEGKVAFTGRTDHVLGCRDVREIYLGLLGGR